MPTKIEPTGIEKDEVTGTETTGQRQDEVV